MDVATLSRIQFALTISFHFLFPPITIGLGLVLVVLQTLRLRTSKPIYTELARFWTRVFGLVFAIGVATGIPLQFQFGTNWPHFARFVGDIFGSPLAIEGIYAFFLESGFLALLLFGWNRIGPKMHWFATCMVALGAHFSAIWILIANSWMQTPTGYHLARRSTGADGSVVETALPAGSVVRAEDLPDVRAVVHSFTEAIFNPSMWDRLAHTVLACWMTGAFLVVGVSAWWLLRGRHVESARVTMKVGLTLALVSCFLQLVAADSTARGVSRNQPTKFASIEGLWETQSQAGLSLAGLVRWKRDAEGTIIGIDDDVVRVPGMLSILVSGDFLHPEQAAQTTVRGLAELPSDDFLRRRHPEATDADLARLRPGYWPNVPIVFQTYHLMVALGVTLTALAAGGCALWFLGRIWKSQVWWVRLFLGLLALSPFMAEIATQAGWVTAEMGRQPWIVYEVLLTADASTTVVSGRQVLTSIILFFLVYAALTVLFLSQLGRLIGAGPSPADRVVGPATEADLLSLKAGRQTQGL